jgi:hypothetical protein
MYLANFLQHRKGYVFPEFPTGNGKIDLIIRYAGQIYGLELKSFTDEFGYQEALAQAARYGQQLGLSEILLICFVETINKTNWTKYETVSEDPQTSVAVVPIFVETSVLGANG